MDALARSAFTVGSQTLSFDQTVVLSIDEENGALDRPDFLGHGSWHADDEKIEESNTRLIGLRASALAKLREINTNFPADAVSKLKSARSLLGQGLHVIADFYSHTNWLELGRTSPNPDFGMRPITFPLASAVEATCAADYRTLTGAGLTKLTSGYYLSVFDGCSAPPGKCRHGKNSCPGIAKDEPDHPRHIAAKSMATTATKAFVQSLLTDAAANGRSAVVVRFMQRVD